MNSSTDKVIWLDFNDAPEQGESTKPKHDARELKQRLIDSLDAVLTYLFPAGKHRGKQFIVGDLEGNPGGEFFTNLTQAEGAAALIAISDNAPTQSELRLNKSSILITSPVDESNVSVFISDWSLTRFGKRILRLFRTLK